MRIVFLLLIISTNLYCQKITLLDYNKKPIENANVRVNNNNYISSKQGQVKISKNLNKSKLTISHLSYYEISDSIMLLKDTNIFLSKKNIELENIVITAQLKKTTSEKAIHNVRVINRKDIDRLAAVSLADVLKQETNIRLNQDNILGSSVSIQGISGQNVKIMIDGVPVLGRLNGDVDISQINLQNIAQIEIIEGPLSVNYGTDALAGTINLISKQNFTNNYQINSYYETVGKYNLNGLINLKFSNHSLTLSGGRHYFDGWSPNDEFKIVPNRTIADTNRFKAWKPKEQFFIKSQHIFKKEKIKINSSIDAFNEKITNRGMPRQPYFESAFDDYYYTKRNSASSKLTITNLNESRITALFVLNNYERIKNTYIKDLTNLTQQLSNNTYDQDTTKFQNLISRSTYNFSLNNYTTSELGYDINYERGVGKRIENQKQKQTDYAIFNNNEFILGSRFILRTGIRLIYNTDYKAPIIPSIHAKHNFNNYSLRASYSRGFRAPSLKELYFEFVDINHNILGNQNLRSENSNNYQFSLSYKAKSKNTILGLSINSFFNRINNLITLAENDEAWSYINVGKYQTIGNRINIDASRKKIKISLSISQIGRHSNVKNNENLNKFKYSMEYASNIYLNLPLEIKFAAFYKYNGPLSSYSINDFGETESIEIDSYSILDLSISKSLFKNRMDLSLGSKNLFNIQNINITGNSSGAHQGSSSSNFVGYGVSFFTSVKYKI